MRIGGEMELQAADFGVELPPDYWPRPQADNVLWTDTGRSALFLAASDHALRGGRKRVHLPGFSCVSVSAPFEAAEFEIAYYDATPGYVGSFPDITEGELLVIIHYFGLENPHSATLNEIANRAGARVIEDLVQASLNRDWRLKADYAVTSLRKFLKVPDGACLLSQTPISSALLPTDEKFISLRIAAKLLRGCSLDPDIYLKLVEESEDSLAPACPRTPSEASALLIRAQDIEEICVRRRENWKYLLDNLEPLQRSGLVQPFLRNLHDDEVPLGFPIIFLNGKRDDIRRGLKDSGMFCPVHWDVSHVPLRTAPNALQLSRQILTIPVDQRYGLLEMKAVIRRLAELLSKHP